MSITSIVLFIRQLFSTFMALLAMMSPFFGMGGAAYQAKNPDELIMSFVAVSDTHIETNNPDSYNAFSNLLAGIKAGKNHDATVFVGDNVMNGQDLENLLFYAGVKAAKPAKENYVVMGNHDIGNGQGDYEKFCNNFIENNKRYLGNDMDEPYYYRVINGCYMIFLASEDLAVNSCVMTYEQLDWLKGVLDEAKAENAVTFVFNHHPIYQLRGVEFDSLAKLLRGYDDVFYIYGHTHTQLTIASFIPVGGIRAVNLPRATELVYYEPGDGIVVEVYENEVVIRGRNFITGEWIRGLDFEYSIG